MTEERNWLQRVAVPQLKVFCSSYDLDFQLVDMRQGVSEYMVTNPESITVSLHEIRECRRISGGQFFLVTNSLASTIDWLIENVYICVYIYIYINIIYMYVYIYTIYIYVYIYIYI